MAQKEEKVSTHRMISFVSSPYGTHAIDLQTGERVSAGIGGSVSGPVEMIEFLNKMRPLNESLQEFVRKKGRQT